MIRVSSAGKSLVSIKSWADISERPGYQEVIDIEIDKPKEFVGYYTLSESPKCGVKGCRTKHSKGYLVVCESGSETNFGNVCGKRLLGANDFEIMKSRFNRTLNAQTYREGIATAKNQIEEIDNRVRLLKEGDGESIGASKIIYDIHAHATRLYSESILKKLSERATKNNGRLNQDIEIIEVDEDNELIRYEQKHIGTIYGISSLAKYKKLRTIVNVRFGSELNTFKSIDETVLKYSDVKLWYKYTNNIEGWFREAEEILAECKRFLVSSNIAFLRSNTQYL